MEAHDLKNGNISPAEQARLNAAQNKVSSDIYKQKHDAQTGNPNSASSKRMQAPTCNATSTSSHASSRA